MVLELFGPEFKDKLFEELVQLNIKALDEAKKEHQDRSHGSPLKNFKRPLAGEEQNLKNGETKGNFNSNNPGKVGNTFTIWKMFSGFVGQCKNKKHPKKIRRLTKLLKQL